MGSSCFNKGGCQALQPLADYETGYTLDFAVHFPVNGLLMIALPTYSDMPQQSY
jgi:hypothetical protein